MRLALRSQPAAAVSQFRVAAPRYSSARRGAGSFRRMHERTLAVDGLRVNVTEWGAGAPVVLLHGLTGSLDYLGVRSPSALARTHRVIAIDVPGHGGSDVLEPFSFTEAVRPDGRGRRPDRRRPAGGASATRSGRRLASPGRRSGRSPAWCLPRRWAWCRWSLRRARFMLPFHRALAATERLWERRRPRRRPVPPGRLRLVRRHGPDRTASTRPSAARWLLRRGPGRAGRARPVLPALAALDLPRARSSASAPALVLWGELDRSGWENGPALAEALGGEELVLPGVGHMPMIEAPYSFGVAVRRVPVGYACPRDPGGPPDPWRCEPAGRPTSLRRARSRSGSCGWPSTARTASSSAATASSPTCEPLLAPCACGGRLAPGGDADSAGV